MYKIYTLYMYIFANSNCTCGCASIHFISVFLLLHCLLKFTYEFRSCFIVCNTYMPVYVCAWVCALGVGGILISIQSLTISPAQPLKDVNEGFPGSPLSTPMYNADRLGKCCDFRIVVRRNPGKIA